MADKVTLQDINEKLDQLLSYQKRQRVWWWIHAMIWLAVFIIFVGIPGYYLYDFVDQPSKYINFSKIQEFQKEFGNFQKQAQQIMNQLQKGM